MFNPCGVKKTSPHLAKFRTDKLSHSATKNIAQVFSGFSTNATYSDDFAAIYN